MKRTRLLRRSWLSKRPDRSATSMPQQCAQERFQTITSPRKSGPTTSTSFGCLGITIKKLSAARRVEFVGRARGSSAEHCPAAPLTSFAAMAAVVPSPPRRQREVARPSARAHRLPRMRRSRSGRKAAATCAAGGDQRQMAAAIVNRGEQHPQDP